MKWSIILFLGLLACKTLHNRLDIAKLDCGGEVQDSEKAYIQIENESGHKLANTSEVGFFAQYRDPSGAWVLSKERSSKGCIVIPKRATSVRVVSSGSGEGAELKSITDRILQLRAIPMLKYDSICSRDGLLARNETQVPWRFSHFENLSLYEIEIEAHGSDGRIYSIFKKDRGIDALELPARLDVSKLSSGAYRLKLKTNNPLVSDGFDSKYVGLDCNLVVRKSAPIIDGVSNSNKLPILKMGESLPWTTKIAGKLFLCSESDEGEPTCQPKKECSNPSNFKEVSKVTKNEAGAYKLFVYGQDELGNQSETICRNAVFTDESPRLSIVWPRTEWNREFARLDMPYADLQVEIAISHMNVKSRVYERTLECKAEVYSKTDENPLKDQLICASGKCLGKSMSDFVPCDQKLTFGLRDPNDERLKDGGKYRFYVRVKGSEKNFITASSNLWFEKSQMQGESIRIEIGGKFYKVLQLTRGEDDNLYLFGAGKLKGEVLEKEPVSSTAQVFNELKTSKIFKHYRSVDKEKSKQVDEFSVWNGASWDVFNRETNEIDSRDSEPCLLVYMDLAENIWCVSKSSRKVLNKSVWVLIENPIINTKKELNFCNEYQFKGNFIALDKDRRFWVVCDSKIYRQNESGEFEPYRFEEDTQLSAKAIFSDSAGVIWGHFLKPKDSSEIFAKLFEKGPEWLPVSQTQKVGWYDTVQVSTGEGVIRYRNQIWNEDLRQWVEVPYFFEEKGLPPHSYSRIIGRPDLEPIRLPASWQNKLPASLLQPIYRVSLTETLVKARGLPHAQEQFPYNFLETVKPQPPLKFGLADTVALEERPSFKLAEFKRRKKIRRLDSIADEKYRRNNPIAAMAGKEYAFFENSFGNVIAVGLKRSEKGYFFDSKKGEWHAYFESTGFADWMEPIEASDGTFWAYNLHENASNYRNDGAYQYWYLKKEQRDTLRFFQTDKYRYFLVEGGFIGKGEQPSQEVKEIDYQAAGLPEDIKDGFRVMPESTIDRAYMILNSGKAIYWDFAQSRSIQLKVPYSDFEPRCPSELSDGSLYFSLGNEIYRQENSDVSLLDTIEPLEEKEGELQCFHVDEEGRIWIKRNGRYQLN